MEPNPAAAAYRFTTHDFTAREGEAGDSVQARQESDSLRVSDSSGEKEVSIRQVAVNSSIDSALKALDQIRFAVSNTIVVRHGKISAQLHASAVDRVFEAIQARRWSGTRWANWFHPTDVPQTGQTPQP